MQRMIQSFRERMTFYIFFAVLFLVGVVFGALMVNALSLEQQQDLGRYLNNFFITVNQMSGSGTAATIASFWDIVALHLKWVAIIWVCGLSVIGLPGILVLNFLKGALIGFSVGFLVGQYSWKGLLFALVSIAPHNLLVIPALLVCSVAAMNFSIQMIKDSVFMPGRSNGFLRPFTSYSLVTASMIVLLIGSACFETWVTPVMMQWTTPMLTALLKI
ncbi:stage II sporulation protein M [Paenibacillus massiliensis]|uniref:stage II sporulation protein M n=1 Tax=Paenibacillus massiliensis TaxID=225917 RepID=UPI00041FC16D|nr:stage II sporulation protein M [Paenibacillus massiliensis]